MKQLLFLATLALCMAPLTSEAGSCPKRCLSWYDGCNTCTCKNGQTTICTKRACKTKGKAYCKQWAPKPRPRTCPKRCVSWFDGCNTCGCKNGKITGCTKIACHKYKKPYCRTWKKPIKKGPCVGCKVWYDGCNTCTCKGGKIAACTKRACKTKGKAYCKQR